MKNNNMIKLNIDGLEVVANKDATILNVAKEHKIEIPTLCHLKNISSPSSCRVCVVEVEGYNRLLTACSTTVRDGMKIKTSSQKVIKERKLNLELLLSNHNKNCLSCPKSTKCQLQNLSATYECEEEKIKGDLSSNHYDDSNSCIVKDLSKCIQCSKCVAVCKNVQSVSAITKIGRGFDSKIGCANDAYLKDSTCVGCGQCTLVCPTAALMEKNDTKKVLEYLDDKNLITIAQVAPAVRVALAEEFGSPIGTFCETKIAKALKMIGFNKVFDINTGADFTVVEESNELIERIKQNKNLPLFSSCCPAWYKFVEVFYPEFAHNLSTCKSPTEMLGALIKSYYADLEKINPNNIRVVDIMPCTAKKGEMMRGKDVDAVLTTREIAKLIKKRGIRFEDLHDDKFDSPLGEYSGAGLIFGVSGGVTEAVLRTAVKTITGKPSESIDFNMVRDSEGIKEVDIPIGENTLKIAIVNGLSNARKVMEDIKSGRKQYTFVEVMACPGGCVNGGGQPYTDRNKLTAEDVVKLRGSTIYKKDKEISNRVSYENSTLKTIYQDYINKTKGLNHKLFHVKRDEH